MRAFPARPLPLSLKCEGLAMVALRDGFDMRAPLCLALVFVIIAH